MAIRIVLIDDHPMVLKGLEQLLRPRRREAESPPPPSPAPAKMPLGTAQRVADAGSSTFSPTHRSIVAFDRSVIGSVGSSGSDFEKALEILSSIDTTPFVKASYPLEEYEKAMLEARSQTILKVMIKADYGA